MPELQRLRAGHAQAVLAFELANRAYFAASVSDRGDEFYDQFTERHNALLAEQEAGTGAFYVIAVQSARPRPPPCRPAPGRLRPVMHRVQRCQRAAGTAYVAQ